MRVRTSQTDPLEIASLPVGEGAIGVTFCPGKKGPSSYGTRWDRDLGMDLETIKSWRAAVMVTLIEDHEFRLLGVEDMSKAVPAAGLEWFWWPIRDVDVPDERFESAWAKEGAALCERIVVGERVVVHCRGGLGRAGMVAARMLVECGVSPVEAIKRVRAERPGAIETAEQEGWVRGLSATRRFR